MKLTLKSISSTLLLSTVLFAGQSFGGYVESTNQMDSNAIAWLIVLNQSEIEMANEAKKRNVNNDVMTFANLMLTEHTDNLNKTVAIGKNQKIEPVKDSHTIEVEAATQKKVEEMKQLDDAKFQKEYVKEMVSGHKDALKELNKQYAPNVSNVALKLHFADTQRHIENHLEKAKALDKKDGV